MSGSENSKAVPSPRLTVEACEIATERARVAWQVQILIREQGFSLREAAGIFNVSPSWLAGKDGLLARARRGESLIPRGQVRLRF